MFDSIDTLSSARQLQQTADTRLANAAHDLAKSELSIEPPVEMITAAHESAIASTLTRTADQMYGHALDILA